MAKINKSIIKIGILFVLGISLLSYDNVKNHGTINEIIVKSFASRNNGAPSTTQKFKNYIFDFEKVKLKGPFITEAGLFNPSQIDNFGGDQLSNLQAAGYNPTYTEATREKTPREWIAHGGFSADEPEVPAGLRHFYDPTKPKGLQYLNDTASSSVSAWFQSWLDNPKTDGVSWALGKNSSVGSDEHNYTFELGKKFIKGALEEANLEKRKKYMAKAWRSLGETLHMIADNGCPPHVRNDSHPPGNVAPYEDILASVDLRVFEKGTVDQSLMKYFRSDKVTAFDIAHKLAVYTNENFFSSETIAGTDQKGRKVKHLTHPYDEYKLPKIGPNDYKDGYYIKTIAGQPIKVCSDKWFFSKFNIPKSTPFIDVECSKSMAKVLIPTIKEAGVNVMRLFIPSLKISITSFSDNGTISGTIKHTTDKEYKNEIKYNGPVVIRNSGTKELATLTARNGKFSGKINSADSKIFAEVEFGGVHVRSERKSRKAKVVKAPEPTEKNEMRIRVRIYVYSTYSDGYKDDNQTFYEKGFHNYETSWEFRVPKTKKFSGSNEKGTIEGEINGKEIVWIKVKYDDTWSSGSKKTRRTTWEATLKNIPLDRLQANDKDRKSGELTGRYILEGWDLSKEKPDPRFQKSLETLEHEVIFYPSGKKVKLEDINYYETAVKKRTSILNAAPRPVIEVMVSRQY